MNNPMSMANTVPARKEHVGGLAPSPINLGRCEAGALHTIRKIDGGRPFQCIRHPEQGSATTTECINHGRTLCAECSTGRIVRARAGVPERPFFIRKEEPVPSKPAKKPKTIVCTGCGRKMAEKAKGVCARCYKYVATGQNIPPLQPELQPKAKPEPKETRISQTATPEQIGPLDDYRGTALADHCGTTGGDAEFDWLEGMMSGIRNLEGTIKNSCRERSILDLSGFKRGPEIIDWLVNLSEDEDDSRTPEGHAYHILCSHKKAKQLLTRDCRCGS